VTLGRVARPQEANSDSVPSLLRARHDRPRRRTAEQRDELAASQGWHALSPLRAAGFSLSLARKDWAGPWANPESF